MLSRYQNSQLLIESQSPNEYLARESSLSYSSLEDGRITVRKHFLENLKQSFQESLGTNVGLICLSVFKIITIVCVLELESIALSSNENGRKEIGLWLQLMMIYDLLQILYLLSLIKFIRQYKAKAITFLTSFESNLFSPMLSVPLIRQQQSQFDNELNRQETSQINTNMNNMNLNYGSNFNIQGVNNKININEFAKKSSVILKYCSILTQIIDGGLFIIGNYLAYAHKDSVSSFPRHYYLLIWLLALGYFSFGVQIILVFSICLCFPLTLFLYLLMRNRNSQASPANLVKSSKKLNSFNYFYVKEIICKLKPVIFQEHFQNQEFQAHKECCICLIEYENSDQVVSLPCSKMHHFHYDCVVKWLGINGVCPICKSPLETISQELQDMPSREL